MEGRMVAVLSKRLASALTRCALMFLIGGFCWKNKFNRVFAMLKEMDEAGLKPAIAYNTLVALYQQNWGFKVCPESPEKDDQGRCGGAHSCYIQLSDKCILLKWKCEWSYGDFQRHESCIQGGSTPNATTYNAIFKGLGEEKDLEKAFELTYERACLQS
ncbi:hypothetical protein POTOM_008431 [Populus tomentosa]|uniref:Pentatricopeptide repeat-containing protein n=1 Tax=Populus tomentosa TaxID=118781 RepID=A0A8X8DE53_POPTO|nr:hypothetical protein POTOM_008431 [Populus tomentosa]